MAECHLKEAKAETLIRIRPFGRVPGCRLHPFQRSAASHRAPIALSSRLKGAKIEARTYRANARKPKDDSFPDAERR
jgi:hypothetical protein